MTDSVATPASTPTITNSLQMVSELGIILNDIVAIALHGLGISTMSDVLQIMSTVHAAIPTVKGALPELKELTPDEVSQLTTSVYNMVQNLIKSIG